MVTQFLRQGDAKVFKKYSQMKLQMRGEPLRKMHRTAIESGVFGQIGQGRGVLRQFCDSFASKANESNEDAVGKRS